MSKILIASLGAGNYKNANYCCDGEIFENAQLPSELLVKIIKPDKIYFVGTNESAWGIADEQIGQMKYHRLVVPYGVQEDDWWQMLKILTGIKIQANDEIFLDITHGFRSMPLFSMLALIYFEKIHDAKTSGVFYGMWENKQKLKIGEKEIEVTPIVDLSPILKIKDWIEGYSLFKNFGDTSIISQLLGKEKAAEELSKQLNNISNVIGINYIRGICKISEEFNRTKSSCISLIDETFPPASLISNELFDVMGWFSGTEEEPYYKTHYRISQWYREHRRYTQCMILLAEIMLTFIVENIDKSKVFDRDFRDTIRVNVLVHKDVRNSFPEIKKAVNLANKMSVLRNQTAHADMRDAKDSQGLRPEEVCKKMQEYSKKVEKIINKSELAEYISCNSGNILKLIESGVNSVENDRLI